MDFSNFFDCLVLEYVEGKLLSSPLPEQEALRIEFQQIHLDV